MNFVLFEDGPNQWLARVQGQLGVEGSGETPQSALGNLIETMARLGAIKVVAFLYKDTIPRAWPATTDEKDTP